jgi:hypothetical protein
MRSWSISLSMSMRASSTRSSAAVICDDPHGKDSTLRAELGDLQAVVRRSKRDLAAAEAAMVGLLARLRAEEQGRVTRHEGQDPQLPVPSPASSRSCLQADAAQA